ncbi:MAG TPA: hypothetical protein VL860_14745 [Planctomycetota bacterium]|jgi:formylmethanofuran dehydrogenase subunit E|nr:hypothetical protein [Planctomycetota bacterium]
MAAKRTACPICGWNSANPAESVDKLGRVAPVADANVHRSKRSEKIICPECLNSFPPEEIQEVNGRKICTSCAAVLEKKSKKPAAKKEEPKAKS